MQKAVTLSTTSSEFSQYMVKMIILVLIGSTQLFTWCGYQIELLSTPAHPIKHKLYDGRWPLLLSCYQSAFPVLMLHFSVTFINLFFSYSLFALYPASSHSHSDILSSFLFPIYRFTHLYSCFHVSMFPPSFHSPSFFFFFISFHFISFLYSFIFLLLFLSPLLQ